MTDLIIYRSCDRPKYVQETLAINMERTSGSPVFLVFDNSTNQDAAEETIKSIAPDVEFYQSEPRIGGPNVVIRAIEVYQEKFGDLDKIFIVDDDVLLPEPLEDGTTWDQLLAEMLDAGWDIVAHPWSNDFRSKETQTIGGVEGYPYAHVNGGCCAFRYDFHKKQPITQISKIRGINSWMLKRRRNDGAKTAYSSRGKMLFEHIDRADHPLSLRDTEYCDWADEMYYERFLKARKQGKTRPKGVAGSW